MSVDEHDDLGEPIAELRRMELEPEFGFRARLRRRLERRRLAGAATDLAIPALLQVLRDLLDLVFGARKGDSK